jgi:predicted AAA+ superfamily ATPase
MMWLTSSGILKLRYKKAIEAELNIIFLSLYYPVIDRKLEVKQEIIYLLKGVRQAGQSLCALLVHPIIKGILEACV